MVVMVVLELVRFCGSMAGLVCGGLCGALCGLGCVHSADLRAPLPGEFTCGVCPEHPFLVAVDGCGDPTVVSTSNIVTALELTLLTQRRRMIFKRVDSHAVVLYREGLNVFADGRLRRAAATVTKSLERDVCVGTT